eukprot:TRINITY_DN3283_c2_g1_i2.p1 TRINITY_DN3283_c2_g1~~TRINITY_DN3283_c2_g1_i2.p1  ORF type:complete len:495 (+),score=71.07 TRINITY_DN3283_c2_g1_i2:77-1561(+)
MTQGTCKPSSDGSSEPEAENATIKVVDETTSLMRKSPDPEEKPPPAKPKKMSEWRPVIVGSGLFVLTAGVCFLRVEWKYNNSDYPIIPIPKEWKTSPIDAVKTWHLVPILWLASIASVPKIGVRSVLVFTFIWCISYICMIMGMFDKFNSSGVGYAFLSMVSGLLLTNVVSRFISMNPIKKFGSDYAEYYIKISMVLMAIELRILREYGPRALGCGWGVGFTTIIVCYLAGCKMFSPPKITNRGSMPADGGDDVMTRELLMLIAVGVSWCGVTAITAISPIIKANPKEIAIAVTLVSFFVSGWMFALPYLAMGIGLHDRVAGAWIGSAVDQTANVVASAAILSDEAKDVANTVKMALNAGLGIVCFALSLAWSNGDSDQGFFTLMWSKFPRFVLGFIILSGFLSLLVFVEEAHFSRLPKATQELSNVFASIGFVCLGLKTDIPALASSFSKGPPLPFYLFCSMIDNCLSLAAGYLLFKDDNLPAEDPLSPSWTD